MYCYYVEKNLTNVLIMTIIPAQKDSGQQFVGCYKLY